MADVKWMNSSGLGSLMAGLTTLRGSGGDLKLAHVPDRVRRPIEITKLDQVIKIYEGVTKNEAEKRLLLRMEGKDYQLGLSINSL